MDAASQPGLTGTVSPQWHCCCSVLSDLASKGTGQPLHLTEISQGREQGTYRRVPRTHSIPSQKGPPAPALTHFY